MHLVDNNNAWMSCRCPNSFMGRRTQNRHDLQIVQASGLWSHTWQLTPVSYLQVYKESSAMEEAWLHVLDL